MTPLVKCLLYNCEDRVPFSRTHVSVEEGACYTRHRRIHALVFRVDGTAQPA